MCVQCEEGALLSALVDGVRTLSIVISCRRGVERGGDGSKVALDQVTTTPEPGPAPSLDVRSWIQHIHELKVRYLKAIN